jgi:hypothetical protein
MNKGYGHYGQQNLQTIANLYYLNTYISTEMRTKTKELGLSLAVFELNK